MVRSEWVASFDTGTISLTLCLLALAQTCFEHHSRPFTGSSLDAIRYATVAHFPTVSYFFLWTASDD